MKIAFLTYKIYPFSIGGIQKHSYFLCKHLASRGCHVTIYHSSSNLNKIKINDYFTPEELDNINFVNVDFPKFLPFPGHYILSSYLFSKRIYERTKEEKHDGIYAQGFTGWYFLRKNRFCKKLITNLHGLEMFQASINFKTKLGHYFLRIPANYIIKHSKKQVSLGGKLTKILRAQGASKQSIKEIPNAIAADWIRTETVKTNQNSPHRFIFIGRNERRKGIEELHQVLNKIGSNADFEMQFIGDISPSDQIKSSNVHYLGTIHDASKIQEELINADTLICPSYSEGMPTVILEAMACGCAIIATDVGAVSELVHNQNGILIEPGNIDQLKKAILSFTQMGNADLHKMKVHSIEKVKTRFTWDVVAEQTIELIKTL